MRQTQALQVMMSGTSVFLTGPPGAGKTYVLNEFVRLAIKRGRSIAVTASTGIAATHIGGTTIHSWSGLGIREHISDYDIQWLKANDKLRKRYNGVDVLIIDEVSMLHGTRLDMVNQACKILRENEKPFGGLQVILVGDLFQLPPVTRGAEVLDFVHTSAAWHELSPAVCYITEQHRQQGDALLDLLEAMRRGEIEDVHVEALQDRLGRKPEVGLPVTRLYAHNVDVEGINQRHLAAIGSETKLYTMQITGAAAKAEQLVKSVLAPEKLELKIGAEVMFVANNFAAGFVNGSRGSVIQFKDGMPLVKLTGGRIIKVEPHGWSLVEDDRKRAEVSQLPLRLAWAITIHKSQGMSLDAAEIDLSKTFTPGMGYVALSRVRSLEGVYLTGVNQLALQMNPHIYEFDRQLQKASALLAEQTDDIEEQTIATEPTASAASLYDDELFEKLRNWRLERARQDKVAPFIIIHDIALKEIATRKPNNAGQLLLLKGFGPKKLASYGPAILELVAAHSGVAAEDINNGWTAEGDSQLLQSFQGGQSLEQAAKTIGRTPEELWDRLQTLLK
jgi:ATP-dependent DNA helicase PIF1